MIFRINDTVYVIDQGKSTCSIQSNVLFRTLLEVWFHSFRKHNNIIPIVCHEKSKSYTAYDSVKFFLRVPLWNRSVDGFPSYRYIASSVYEDWKNKNSAPVSEYATGTLISTRFMLPTYSFISVLNRNRGTKKILKVYLWP